MNAPGVCRDSAEADILPAITPAGSTADPDSEHHVIESLQYNACVLDVRRVHKELLVLRVLPDGGVPAYRPGQYATLGLWSTEACHADVESSTALPASEPELIQRAYSLSCPMIDEHGALVTCRDLPYLEFYISRVASPGNVRAQLTPRLFALTPGRRLYVAPRVRGHYTLTPVRDGDTVVFMATGTGEAPHNAMTAELLSGRHRGAILSAVCVRRHVDLAYLAAHQELQRRFAHYRYVPLTTREPENVDPTLPNYIGPSRLQTYVRAGRLAADLGKRVDPSRTHIYLCGNPGMIGLPAAAARGESAPSADGVVVLLMALGFQLDRPHCRGQIHVEQYR